MGTTRATMPSRNPRRVANTGHLGHLRVHGMCTISAWCVHSGSSLTVYGLALPWWLDASAARSRCAGLRPALALCECTPRCPCAPTPPIRSSLPWQCRSAQGLERWDEMNLPWASLPPDRWDVGAPWRGTRSHWRVSKCTARAVFACEGGGGDGGARYGKFRQDGACLNQGVETRGSSMREAEQGAR